MWLFHDLILNLIGKFYLQSMIAPSELTEIFDNLLPI